jgi:hypothetical protein
VNGKNVHQFIDTDIPRIHEVIQSVTLNGNRINLKSMNEMLYEQLTKIKQTHITSSSNEGEIEGSKPKEVCITRVNTDDLADYKTFLIFCLQLSL